MTAPRQHPPTNLPAPLTSFVGRHAELTAVASALAATRLVTLTGFGGVGKTRIALEASTRARDQFADGVWLVELEAVRRDDDVVQALATALRGVMPGLRASLPQIVGQLRARNLLLVLDNCEQVAPACATLVVELLRGCLDIRILATSREQLGVPGEAIVRVEPFAVPGSTNLPAADDVLGFESVRLFRERARHAAPGFVVGDTNAAPIAHICRRLDGIPLAIELAAARLTSIGVFELSERLDSSFGLLRSRSHGVHARHLTLTATIDWSHDLLSPSEAELFRRLSVFHGGWSLELFERFAVTTGAENALDALARLVERSLVQVDTTGERTRYRLLEVIKEFATQRLDSAGETAAYRDTHARIVAEFGVRWGRELRGPRQVEAADRLEADHENVRAAIGWFIERGETDAALTLTTSVWRFWSYRAYLAEGRRWLTAALDGCAEPSAPGLVAEASFALGRFAHQQADFGSARGAYGRALEMARRAGAAEVIAATLVQLGHFARNEDNFDEARALYEESLANCDASVDATVRAIALIGIGAIAQLRDRPEEALSYFESAAAIVGDRDDRSLIGYVALRLAHASLDLRDMSTAARAFRQALDIAADLRAHTQLAAAIEGAASFAAARADAETARSLAAAAASLRAESASRMSEWESGRLRRWLARAGVTIDGSPCNEKPQTIEDTVATARSALEHSRPMAAATALTPREFEVARLVAAGLSNREIGSSLVIAEGTAGLHVKHILRKLGFARRAQIGVWIARGPTSDIS